MRHLVAMLWGLALAALALAAPAEAAYRYFTESQALSRSAPTNETTASANGQYMGETEGVDLAGAIGYRVCVAAASGQTLSGGTIKTYVYSYHSGLWGENTGLAQTVNSTTRTQCWDFQVTVGRGRVLPATSSVTVSSGTTVTVSVTVFYADK